MGVTRRQYSSRHRRAVNQYDLKRWQTDKLSAQLRPTLAYLGRLKSRMEKRGFTADDKLYQLVCKAQSAMQELVMERQCLAFEGGVGRK